MKHSATYFHDYPLFCEIRLRYTFILAYYVNRLGNDFSILCFVNILRQSFLTAEVHTVEVVDFDVRCAKLMQIPPGPTTLDHKIFKDDLYVSFDSRVLSFIVLRK